MAGRNSAANLPASPSQRGAPAAENRPGRRHNTRRNRRCRTQRTSSTGYAPGSGQPRTRASSSAEAYIALLLPGPDARRDGATTRAAIQLRAQRPQAGRSPSGGAAAQPGKGGEAQSLGIAVQPTLKLHCKGSGGDSAILNLSDIGSANS